MLRKVEIFLRDEDTLTEEVLVNGLAVGFGDKPADIRTYLVYWGLRSLHCREFLALFGESL